METISAARLQELAGILNESIHGNKRVMIVALERESGALVDVLGPGAFGSLMAERFGSTPELKQSFMDALAGSVDGADGAKSFAWDEHLMMVVIPAHVLKK